jgi:alpha-1,2-mannosyltransferase
MTAGSRNLGTMALVAALLAHILAVLSPAWWQTRDSDQGRDFASYYYAARVAAVGGDPYDTQQLNAQAQADGSRGGVHPFLYAPPFLLSMAWAPSLDLAGAYHLWFWLHELCLVATMLVLWGWWRPLSEHVPWVLACLVALMTAIPNNHLMGQANFPGLALAMGGLWATDRKLPLLGGALLGTACMLKMSPALLVLWWLLRREWTAAVASVGMAVLLSLLTLPWAGVQVQTGFYTHVLPGFGSGDYNGLSVPIGMFGNHSLPNLFHQWFPSGRGTLSATARSLSLLGNVAMLGGLAWAFRAPSDEPLQRAAQSGAVGIVILLFPVYTYEHHLVWALPAAAIGVLGVLGGRLGVRYAGVLGVAVALLCCELAGLKRWADAEDTLWLVGQATQELKTVSLFALLATTIRLGRTKEPG